jgi:hypothetical protein
MEKKGRLQGPDVLRSDSNRRSYEKAKTRQDHVLLRLDKGDLEKLDAASITIGVSRAAFARMFLLPMLNAFAARIPEIEKARAERRQSLPQFLALAISNSLASVPSQPEATMAGDEFDALFGPTDGAG